MKKITVEGYSIAVKQNLILTTFTSEQASFIYASEADILSVALFGRTAQNWRAQNPDKKGNMRDYADIH